MNSLLIFLFINTGGDEFSEERVSLVRTALELRMELNAQMEAVLRLLDRLYDRAVRRSSSDLQACL